MASEIIFASLQDIFYLVLLIGGGYFFGKSLL